MKLNGRQIKFVHNVFGTLMNHAQAYRLAGYNPRNAKVSAWRLWRKPAVQAYFREMQDELQELIEKENRDQLSEKNYLQYEMKHKDTCYTARHLIEQQPVHFGGYRYYFICTCHKKAILCGRRVKSLILWR